VGPWLGIRTAKGRLSDQGFRIEDPEASLDPRFLQDLEVPSGFEPLNIGFADRPLGPLGHGTSAESVWYPLIQKLPSPIQGQTKVSVDKAQSEIPNAKDVNALRSIAANCQACDLWKTATQTVFGEGSQSAKVFMVGEQPGDKEDTEGRPFVGPAGQILDKCMQEAGLDRNLVYVTNTVKHFKWVESGGRRLHKRPGTREIRACFPWLQGEIALVSPEVLICLGAVAAQTLIAPDFKITQHRGEFVSTQWSGATLATIHPSSILRMPDQGARQEARNSLIADLKLVRARVGGAEQIRTAE
jgi:uracil-DNA glycosylase family protein